jgi:hypothetical protein
MIGGFLLEEYQFDHRLQFRVDNGHQIGLATDSGEIIFSCFILD